MHAVHYYIDNVWDILIRHRYIHLFHGAVHVWHFMSLSLPVPNTFYSVLYPYYLHAKNNERTIQGILSLTLYGLVLITLKK